MSLTYTFSAAERIMAADQRLAAALATIRRALGTERPDPPPGWEPGPRWLRGSRPSWRD